MQTMSSDDIMRDWYTHHMDLGFFNELMSFLNGCAEFFSTTSDATDSPDEKKQFREHAMDLRSTQSNLVSRVCRDDDYVILTLSDDMQSALFYTLVSMLSPEQSSEDPDLPEKAPLLPDAGGYSCYPLYKEQYAQVLHALQNSVEELDAFLSTIDPEESLGAAESWNAMEERRQAASELAASLEKQSYCFRDAETGRLSVALMVKQYQVDDLFRALLVQTCLNYESIDYASKLQPLS